MNTAFFVSNHGFGHLMRELPVMAELLDRGNRVVLVTGEGLLRVAGRYLAGHGNGDFIGIADEVDVGLLMVPGTLRVDWTATAARLRGFIADWPEKIESAKRLLADCGIGAALVDIVPWAIPAAKEAGVPVCLCSNFTWLEEYEGHLADELVAPFRDCYAQADRVLLQALASERMRRRYPDGCDVGFFCRPFDEAKVRGIRELHAQPVVYVSVGGGNSGLQERVDVGGLPYDFIVTAGLDFTGPNVTRLPTDTGNTNDYVAAADYCISKAGWASIAEEMIAGKRTALLLRPDAPEDMDNIRGLERLGRAVGVDAGLLREPGRIIELLDGMAVPAPCGNGYGKVAELLLRTQRR